MTPTTKNKEQFTAGAMRAAEKLLKVRHGELGQTDAEWREQVAEIIITAMVKRDLERIEAAISKANGE